MDLKIVIGGNLSAIEYLAYYKLNIEYKPIKDLCKDLKSLLAEKAAELLKEYRQIKPPFFPEKIIKVNKAQIKIEYLSPNKIDCEGKLIPTPTGFKILVKKTNKLKERTTIAHELSHIFFYETNVLPPLRLGPPVRYPSKEYWREEDICRYVAREFLMPSFSISTY